MRGAANADVADIDDDGDLDVFVSIDISLGFGNYIGRVEWWENDGDPLDGDWTRHTIDGNFLRAIRVVSVDMDSDGDRDVMGIAGTRSTIAWWENDGTPRVGAWPRHIIDDSFTRILQAFPADLDGDGDSDVIYHDSLASGAQLYWSENLGSPGNGRSWIKRSMGPGRTSGSIVPADIDADGDLDVVGLTTEDPDVFMSWMENDGTPADGEWVRRNVPQLFPSFGIGVTGHGVAADLDMDGDLDYALLGTNQNPVIPSFDLTWLENGGGAPDDGWKHHVIDEHFASGLDLKAADLDGDGDIDLIGTGHEFQHEIRWWENLLIDWPGLDWAYVRTGRTVDVRFDRPMTASAGDAAAYAISGAGAGTLAAGPIEAIALDARTVRLYWNAGAMTPGADVTITATGLTDQDGNTMGRPASATHRGGGAALQTAARWWTIYP